MIRLSGFDFGALSLKCLEFWDPHGGFWSEGLATCCETENAQPDGLSLPGYS